MLNLPARWQDCTWASQRDMKAQWMCRTCAHTCRALQKIPKAYKQNRMYWNTPIWLGENRVEGVDDSLTLCRKADEMLIVLGEGYHGGSHASALRVFNGLSLLSLHDGNA